MKAQSSSPLRLGAFNQASQTMSNQLNAYISNYRPENVKLFQNNNICMVHDKESLSVRVDVLPGVQEFATPTEAMICQELVNGDTVASVKK